METEKEHAAATVDSEDAKKKPKKTMKQTIQEAQEKEGDVRAKEVEARLTEARARELEAQARLKEAESNNAQSAMLNSLVLTLLQKIENKPQ